MVINVKNTNQLARLVDYLCELGYTHQTGVKLELKTFIPFWDKYERNLCLRLVETDGFRDKPFIMVGSRDFYLSNELYQNLDVLDYEVYFNAMTPY